MKTFKFIDIPPVEKKIDWTKIRRKTSDNKHLSSQVDIFFESDSKYTVYLGTISYKNDLWKFNDYVNNDQAKVIEYLINYSRRRKIID